MTYSVQLYSVRNSIEEDLAGTIDRLAALGFTQVEPYNFVDRAEEFAAAFAKNSLSAPTAHAPLITGDQDAIFAAAQKLGIGTVIDPFIPAEKWQSESDIQQTAAALNAAAAKGAEYGIRVGYHNHDWEISSKINSVTALEYFATLLDEAVVLEVDTYWVAVGGENPAEVLSRLGSKVIAVHIKDGPLNKDNKAQQPAGQGKVDIWSVLGAVQNLEVGVIEFDDYAGDVFEGIAASLAYLNAGPQAANAAGGQA